MSWTISGVTLPSNPTRITYRKSGDFKDIRIPGGLPLIISYGLKSDSLVLEGWMAEAGKTLDQLYTDYLAPLFGNVHTQVAVDGPGTKYDANWLLDDVEFREEGGITRAYRLRIKLRKGSDHLVM
jgi:hypothetical protein